MKISPKLKAFLQRSESLRRGVRYLYNLPKKIQYKLGMYSHPQMLDGELEFFKAIYRQCKVIVDVGTRYDVDYVEISKGNGIRYFLFEANPRFYKKLKSKLTDFNENIISVNMAVGEREGFTEYFQDSESVLKNTTAIKNSSMQLSKSIKMGRLDSFLMSYKVSGIDFLKTDIEEYDYFAWVGLGELLNKCKYIQFELGLGAPVGDTIVTNEHYFSLLEASFDLYILRDENNPLWSEQKLKGDLIFLDNRAKILIDKAQQIGVGFNIVAVNKSIKTDLSKLEITTCDGN